MAELLGRSARVGCGRRIPNRRPRGCFVDPDPLRQAGGELQLAQAPAGDAVRLDPRRGRSQVVRRVDVEGEAGLVEPDSARLRDRKSTRLNSSHVKNSYAVFCLKK